MKDKVKGGLSIFLISFGYCMMNSHALGDYILESIGLKSWTGDYIGTHLTVIYFGILFIIGLFLVKKYVVVGLNIRRRSVVLIFIVLMKVFSSIIGITERNIKKNSLGLLAIGNNFDGSNMNYKSEDNKVIQFIAKIKLTNYSNEKKTFYLSIDSPFYREVGIEEISFYNFDGKQAIFQLESNETKTFSLSLDNYNVVGGRTDGGESGSIQEIILTNDKGKKVRLNRIDFFGTELSK